jgi:putative sigma-54 modulation protein
VKACSIPTQAIAGGDIREESPVRIEVKGRNLPVNDELREHVTRRFKKIDKQVSDLAVLEIEVCKERNPANPDNMVAEATLYLKGVTLRAKDASGNLEHSINLVADELGRQVKRHRDKRRRRREQRAAAAAPQMPPDAAGGQLPAV